MKPLLAALIGNCSSACFAVRVVATIRQYGRDSLPALACLLLVLSATTAWADEAPPKIAAPDAAAIQAATKLVREVYAADLAAAKKPEDKAACARKLVTVAAEEKAPAGRYAALALARDLAADAGDAAAANAIVDQLDGQFQIDALKMKVDAAITAAKGVRKPDEKKAFLTALGPVVDQAIIADRYGLASQLAGLATDAGPAGAATARWVREAEIAYAASQKAQAVLVDRALDPAANLTVGKYQCFIKGQWDKGLPELVLSGEAALAALAQKEIAGVTAAEEQVALADGWFDRGEKEVGLAQRRIRKHAADWYSAALPQLSGLTKARVEKRLAELASEGTPGATKSIDLLELVDASKGAVGGAWTLKEGVLTSDLDSNSRIQFPYHAPTEYDLRVVFCREQGEEPIFLILAAGGKQFHWAMGGWGNSIMGFQRIGNMTADRNKTSVVVKPAIENGKKYEVIIKVRKNGVAAMVNGKQVTQYQTDYSDVAINPAYALRDPQTIGVGGMGNIVKFLKVEVVEVAGQGAVTKERR